MYTHIYRSIYAIIYIYIYTSFFKFVFCWSQPEAGEGNQKGKSCATAKIPARLGHVIVLLMYIYIYIYIYI